MSNLALQVEVSVEEIPSSEEVSHTARPWLARFSKLLVLATFFLIFMGALVTSNDAGLAVPDWPTTYGENMFLYPPSKWVGTIFYEHVHRLVASVIGLLTLILAIWTGFVESRRSVRILSYVALAAVIIQGVLGGLTVLYLLPPAVSIAHGVLAQTFFILTIIIAYSHSAEWHQRLNALNPSSALSSRYTLAFLGAFAVYIQLFLGALMRHTRAGLAIPDFPTMGGSWLPRFDSEMLAAIQKLRFEIHLGEANMSQILIHLAHRAGAVLVTLLLGYLILTVFSEHRRSSKISNTLRLMGIILIAQFALGVATVLSVRSPIITSAHVLFGAGLLGVSVLLLLRLYPIKGPQSRISP